MERSCIERLSRLANTDGTPYTALTVLKAYYPSSAEAIVKLEGGSYRLTESVGLDKCDDQADSFMFLNAEIPENGYLAFPAEKFRFECASSDATAFAFPIFDRTASRSGFYVFIAKDCDRAMLSSLARIVHSCSRKLIPDQPKAQGEKQKTSSAISAETASDNGIRALGESHVIVFKCAESRQERIRELALSRLGNLGVAFSVVSDRIAVFLKSSLDRELYAHQLRNSLRKALSLSDDELTIIAQGFAENAAHALAIIRPNK